MALPPQDTEKVSALCREFDAVKETRGIWNNHWEDVARLVLPQFCQSFNSTPTPGTERGQEMFDATANTALFRFAAAMESMLTPRNGKWHRFRVIEPELMKRRSVQVWCDQVNDILFRYRYAQTANFQGQQHDGYVSIGAFGTSALFVDQNRDKATTGLRYRNVHLGEAYFAENHQGVVDTVWRRVPMSVRQIAQRWGAESLGDKLGGMLERAPEERVHVLHGVRPREEWDPYRLDSRGMRFMSCYILEDTRALLEESGFRTFPYSTARYMTAPGEVYGRSPAMMVLPAIKVLNEEKKTFLKQGHRTVDPVLLAHDDGVLNGFSLRPGAINSGAVNSDGRPLVHALPVGNLNEMKPLMDDERATINDAFLVSLFQILTESPQMTATEVLERAREKGALLSPTMGRFQSEALGPLIAREYDVLNQQGIIPQPPPELIEANAAWHVEFDAPLNRAMRAEEGAGLQRTVQFGIEVSQATQDPSILDVFDFDTAMRDLADINGTPYRWLKDPALVQQARAGRQNQQQTQNLIDAAPALAATLKAAAPQGTQATP